MLKAYFVQESNEPCGLAVIAENTKEAKKLAYATGDFCDWISLRVRWIKNCNIIGLEKGILNDSLEGVRRDIFSYVKSLPCDKCGRVDELQGYKGQALCYQCYEEAV